MTPALRFSPLANQVRNACAGEIPHDASAFGFYVADWACTGVDPHEEKAFFLLTSHWILFCAFARLGEVTRSIALEEERNALKASA